MILSYNTLLNEAEQSISSSDSVEDEEFNHIEHLMGISKDDQSNLKKQETSSKKREVQIAKHTSSEIETDEILSKVIGKAWKHNSLDKKTKATREKELSTSSSNNKKKSAISIGSKENLSRAEDCIQRKYWESSKMILKEKIQKNEISPCSMTVVEQPAILEDSVMEFHSNDKSSCSQKGKNFILKSIFASNGNSENDNQSGNSGFSQINKTNELEELNDSNNHNSSNNNTNGNNNNNNWLQNYYTPLSKNSEAYTKYNISFCNAMINHNDHDNTHNDIENNAIKAKNANEYDTEKQNKKANSAKDNDDVNKHNQNNEEHVRKGSNKNTQLLQGIENEMINDFNQPMNQMNMNMNMLNQGLNMNFNNGNINKDSFELDWEPMNQLDQFKSNNNNNKHKHNNNLKTQNKNLKKMMQQQGDSCSSSTPKILKNCLALAKEQFGCRILQKEIDKNPLHVSKLFYEEIRDHFTEWSCDWFGNYFIQKLIQHLPELIIQDIIQVVIQKDFKTMSYNQYGTRVIQVIISISKQNESFMKIITSWIKPNLSYFIYDQNACHVISAYVSTIPYPMNDFVYSYLSSKIYETATQKYSCLVWQKAIQNASTQQSNWLFTISQSSYKLFNNQFGNYVLQYTINLCNHYVNHTIVLNLLMDFQKFSSMKYSSSIIEKCMQCSNKETLNLIFERLCNDYTLTQGMMCDIYGNYVIQRAWQWVVEPYKHRLLEIVGQNWEHWKTLAFGNKLYSKWIKNYPEWLNFARKQEGFTNNVNYNNMRMNINGSKGVIIKTTPNISNKCSNNNVNMNMINNGKRFTNMGTCSSSGNNIQIEQLNNFNNVYINNGMMPNSVNNNNNNNNNINWEFPVQNHSVSTSNQSNKCLMLSNNKYHQGWGHISINNPNLWVFEYNKNDKPYTNPNFEYN